MIKYIENIPIIRGAIKKGIPFCIRNLHIGFQNKIRLNLIFRKGRFFY